MNKINLLLIALLGVVVFSNPTLGEIRFNAESPRLDALQLMVSIEDEGNVIGLDKYAGNPSGILLDEPQSRFSVGGNQLRTESEYGEDPINNFLEKQNTLGLVGIFRNKRQALRVDSTNQNYRTDVFKTDEFTGSMAYNQRISNFFIGLDTSVNRKKLTSDYTTEKIESDPLSLNLGLAYTPEFGDGNIQLGMNHIESRTKVSNSDNTQRDRQNGVQAIYSLQNSFKAAVKYDLQSTKDTYGSSVGDTDASDLGLRILATPKTFPLQFGGEVKLNSEKTAYTYSGDPTSDLDSKWLRARLGVSLVKKEIGLVGIEQEYSNFSEEENYYASWGNSYTYKYKSRRQETILGGEIYLFSKLLARASCSYQTYLQDNSPNLVKVAAGLGYNFNSVGKVDIAFNKLELKSVPNIDSNEKKISFLGSLYF